MTQPMKTETIKTTTPSETTTVIKVVYFLAALPLLISLGILSVWLSQLSFSRTYGLESVLWAVVIGLIVRNTIGLPQQLRRGLRAESFIKTGLTLLGASVLFGDLLAFGAKGMAQALVVIVSVYYVAYYVSTRLGLNKSFAHMIAAGVSICGVSAAIAAAGAIKGDKKELTYTISMVVAVAIPMLLLMPLAGRLLSLPAAVLGAWIGGTIDTTPAVAAAGTLSGSEEALKVATIVKLSQNTLIGVVAFILAAYWALRVERRPDQSPSPLEIWYRFPKFILGFIVMSIVASLGLFTKTQIGVITTARSWFFVFAFVCIGLETSLRDFRKIGGRPFYSFILAQLFNIALTGFVARLLFGGILGG